MPSNSKSAYCVNVALLPLRSINPALPTFPLCAISLFFVYCVSIFELGSFCQKNRSRSPYIITIRHAVFSEKRPKRVRKASNSRNLRPPTPTPKYACKCFLRNLFGVRVLLLLPLKNGLNTGFKPFFFFCSSPARGHLHRIFELQFV